MPFFLTNTYQTACVVCEPGHRKLSFTLSNVYTQDSRIKNKEICKEKFELTYVCTSERYVHISPSTYTYIKKGKITWVLTLKI